LMDGTDFSLKSHDWLWFCFEKLFNAFSHVFRKVVLSFIGSNSKEYDFSSKGLLE
jgi:hypothetical protein